MGAGDSQGRLLARLLAVAVGLVVALGALALVLWRRPPPADEHAVTLAEVLREPSLADQLLERMARDNKGEFDTHPDADLGHVNLKGTYERSFGKVEINTYGVREREYALPKPAGTVRVVLLGDSFVWGWELPAEQRMGVHLERALLERRQRPDLAPEVLHLGVTSWNLIGECAFVRRQLDQLQPDLVIQISPLNDLDDTTGARGFGAMGNYVPRSPRQGDNVVRMLSAQDALGVDIENDLTLGLGWESLSRFAGSRAAVLGLVAALGRRPEHGRYLLVGHWGEANAALHAHLGSELAQGAVVYLPADFRDDVATRLAPGDPHWNAAGNERVGRILYGLIRARGLLPELVLAPWPEAEREALDLSEQGWREAQEYDALVAPRLSDMSSAIETRSLTRSTARQVLIGLDAERLVSSYASFLLAQPAPAGHVRIQGRCLDETSLAGARVHVFAEEHEVGAFELEPGRPLDHAFALPSSLGERRVLSVRLQADDFVYRGKALRHFVAFALERLALE
jgi:hypothetical protein